jgi:pimeloyl-ACP methyl ester carboxylesterase
MVAFVAFAIAAACTSPDRQPTATTSRVPPSDSTSDVDWGSCPDDYFVPSPSGSFETSLVDCATLDVPAAYGRESGLPDFRLAMMRVRTTGEATKRGTLFVNPGGPGMSGIEEVQYLSFPQDISDSYDVVGFDPRGVLHSQPASGGPIRCSDELDFSSYWTIETTPANETQADANERLEDEYQTDCERRNPAWWTLGTRNVVRDLERLRQHVSGDADLNFLGSSYGTTIAAGYIRAFPEHVGHIVLDSPTDDRPDSDASIVTQARSINGSLMRLVDGYADATRSTRGTVVRQLQQIAEWGEEDQLRGYAGLEPFPGSPTERLSNEGLFYKGLVALLYYEPGQAQQLFDRGIDDLLQQKGNHLFEYLALYTDGYDTDRMFQAYEDREPYDPHGYTRDNSFEVREMVNGIDRDQRDTRSPAEQDALDRKVKAAAPLLWRLGSDPSGFRFHDARGGNRWSWAAFDDLDVPDPPKRPPVYANPSGTPVMVIGSRHESITPYPFAVHAAEALGSALITWEGGEHAPLAGFEHTCLNELFVEYLVHDTLPEGPVTCTD